MLSVGILSARGTLTRIDRIMSDLKAIPENQFIKILVGIITTLLALLIAVMLTLSTFWIRQNDARIGELERWRLEEIKQASPSELTRRITALEEGLANDREQQAVQERYLRDQIMNINANIVRIAEKINVQVK